MCSPFCSPQNTFFGSFFFAINAEIATWGSPCNVKSTHATLRGDPQGGDQHAAWMNCNALGETRKLGGYVQLAIYTCNLERRHVGGIWTFLDMPILPPSSLHHKINPPSVIYTKIYNLSHPRLLQEAACRCYGAQRQLSHSTRGLGRESFWPTPRCIFFNSITGIITSLALLD